jgi:tetratricopeptide (TPR) repeat protein
MKMRNILFRLVGARDRHCPSEAEVLAYSENRLSRRSRARFERHFAQCDDCLELLAFLGRATEAPALLAQQAVSEQTNRVLALIERDERNRSKAVDKERSAAGGFYISYPKLAAIGLVACALAVAGVLLITREQAPADAAMEALRLAVKDARYTQARVSGGLEYSGYEVTRGGDSRNDDLHFRRAFSKLKSAEKETAPVNDKLVLARVYLARGTRVDAEHALAILNQLAARGVETPEALNDTGVAQFQLDNYDDAIAYFSRALAKSPTYGEALFNRALAEERAHRDGDARQDWQQFIDHSSDDHWKSEARIHLRALGGVNDR